MKKIDSVDNKLKLYSTLALGVMSAGAVNAQVVYHDVNPDSTVMGVSGTASRDSILIDINHDGIVDFDLQIRVYGTTPTNTQANLNIMATGNQCLQSLVAYTYLGYANNVPSGTLIGAASAWTSTSNQAVLASIYSGTNYGTLGDGLDHYLGVKFMDNAAALHYGWIRVSAVDANGTTATLKDFAYQTIADSGIVAGDIGTGISTTAKVESNIYSFNKNIYVNFNSEIQGDINVFNSLGELVLTDKMVGVKKEINMSSQASGIYMIRIESATGNFTKKIKI